MPAVTAAVLEVGPAAVRRISPLPVVRPDAMMVAAALAGVDDGVVLLDERPVDVMALWRSIIVSAVGSEPATMTIVVPSWWSQRRVGRVADAATTVADDVVAVSRSQLIARSTDPDIVIVEIADDVIAVTAGESVTMLARSCDADGVARAAIGAARGATRIVIDPPFGVVGADESSRRIRAALEDRGVAGAVVQIADVAPVTRPAVTTTYQRRSPFTPAAVAGASVALVMCVVGIAMAHPKPSTPAPADDATNLVEGRITVRIPLRWSVTRVTAGPGSRRVRVNSATDGGAALHITQSYVPGEKLDTTSEVLQRAVAEQPAGVFVDFQPRDRRAGRPAVTYREVRDGRDIRWVVLVDGATRISIGCQSAPGREDAIRGVCDEAVRSAREITGTPQQH